MSKVVRIGNEVLMNCPCNGLWNCPKDDHTKDYEKPPINQRLTLLFILGSKIA
jgi:hypothetical protein